MDSLENTKYVQENSYTIIEIFIDVQTIYAISQSSSTVNEAVRIRAR